MLTDLLEALTIFFFGLSWPISIRKSFVARTAKGKSLFFEVFILVGYACGIVRKAIQTADVAVNHDFLFYLSFFFYVLNFIMITIDVMLYFRNTRLDRIRDGETPAS